MLFQVLPFFFVILKEDVLAPPPENEDVVNDFDIEEEVIEVENRFVLNSDFSSGLENDFLQTQIQ